MTDEEKVTEKRNKVQPEENIERLKKIRQKRTSGVSMKYMAGAGAAVAVVIVVAVAGGVLGKSGESRAGRIKVETVEASLETTAPPETSGEPASIVLETTLSAEEIAEKEHDEAVQKVLDGYANLGIAGVSGYLNVRKIPETYGEVVGKLLSGGACEIIDTSTDGWYKISSGGVTGYVSSQYIYTGDKAREVAAENVIERAVVSTDKLNVRKEPSQDSEIMGQVYKDERYPVESIQDGWVQIDDGYLSADYVTVRYALNEARKQDMRTTVLSLYENLGVSNVSNYLNVRDKASERDGKIIAKLPSNAGCDILETTDDGWYKIRSGKITGYVKSEYILTGQQAEDKAMQVAKLMAIANTDGVNVRSEPNTESSIWTQIASSEKFLVASQQDGWVEIELDDSTAFISSDYVDVKYGLNEAIPYTPVVEAPAKGNGSTGSSKPSGGTTSKPGKGGSSKPSGGSANDGAAGSSAGSVSSKRAQIANYAVQFVGNPYVWGGTSLTNGADCSGFTMSVMAHFGVSLPHSSSAQAGCGKSIKSSQMRPGDLVFYSGSGGGINHVALYIGNGQVVHASSKRTGIKISSWNYRSPSKIVNVLGD
ncbi:cell wall-associated hydrolases (Invasion-associated proteins) [Clostridium sp. CAG:58]|uniref:C40 family peptidase n=1 Tax=Alitiscatomonas sp. TaxID=2981647 RepID=UPI0003409FCD|nr:cell wall-associated hydrolases (Invasion-associated proteins) [Clostridium sp. CAG:58]